MALKLNIIICVYNSKKYLDDCLNSINIQANKEQVLISIIDDGGTDDYKDILMKYEGKLEIEYYKLKKNKGVGFARNFGIKVTNLPFITFLDSDDEFYDCNSLQKLLNKFDNKNIDLVIGLEKRNTETINHYGHLHGKVYRRTALEKRNILFPNDRYGEDIVFNITFLSSLKDENIKEINEVVYKWKEDNKESLTKLYDIDKEMYYLIKDIKLVKKYMKKNKIYNLNYRYALILIEGLYNNYNGKYKNSSVENQIYFFKNCNKIYNLFEKEIKHQLNINREDKYYDRIKQFIILFKNY